MPATGFHNITKHCQTCGQPLILRNQRDVQRKNFCSRVCSSQHKAQQLWATQRARLLPLIAAAAQRPGVSDKKAQHGSAHPGWKGGDVIRQCRWCGTEFKARRYRAATENKGNGVYCSKACYLTHHAAGAHQGERLPSVCGVCGKVTHHQPYWALRRKTCSRRCSAIRAAQTVAARTSGTWIEDAVEALLVALNVPYEKQKALLGLTLCDFFVAPDLVIYTDGTFWHSKPKRQQQDAFVTRRLIAAGYRVLRFPEAMIASAEDVVISRLKEAVHA